MATPSQKQSLGEAKDAFLNDHWVLEDHFGMAGAGDALARQVLEVPPPFTLSVTGKWGSGKTTLMRRAFVTLGGAPIGRKGSFDKETLEMDWDQLQKWCFCNLDPKKRQTVYGKDGATKGLPEVNQSRNPPLNWDGELRQVADASFYVWYSPWQYQYEPNPVVPLLNEIMAQFKLSHKLQRLNRHGGIAGLTLLAQALETADALFSGGKLVAGVRQAVQKTKQAWDQSSGTNLLKPTDGQRFHLLFQEAIDTLLDAIAPNSKKAAKPANPSGKRPRMVIFIDDLDRCEEGQILRLLECIKLYLHCRSCVFVLGLDDAAVLRALKHHWPKRAEDDNREYLEKLMQQHFPMPRPRQDKIKTFIQDFLQQIPERRDHSLGDRESLAGQIQQLIEPNPRKIKNFLNNLRGSWQLLTLPQALSGEAQRIPGLEDAKIPQAFMLCQYLRLYHRPVWRLLERQPDLLKLLTHTLRDTLSELESGDLSGGHIQAARLFQRSFVHVMERKPDEQDTVQSLPLEDAANLLLERLDRKRSDQYFVTCCNDVLYGLKILPDCFLEYHEEQA